MDRKASEGLKVGDLVYWGNDPTDQGEVLETNWVGVKIAWDDEDQIGVIHHDDMAMVTKLAVRP